MGETISLDEFLNLVPHLTNDSPVTELLNELFILGAKIRFETIEASEWDPEENVEEQN